MGRQGQFRSIGSHILDMCMFGMHQRFLCLFGSGKAAPVENVDFVYVAYMSIFYKKPDKMHVTSLNMRCVSVLKLLPIIGHKIKKNPHNFFRQIHKA